MIIGKRKYYFKMHPNVRNRENYKHQILFYFTNLYNCLTCETLCNFDLEKCFINKMLLLL